MDSSKLKNISEEFKARVRDTAVQAVDRVKDTAELAVDRAKNGTQVAANAVDSLKNPAHILNSAGSKLNDLSHDYFGRLLKEQRKIVDGVVEDSAQRLRVMADADNLQKFCGDQVALFPATRERMVGNVKQTLQILGHTRDGLKDLYQSTVVEFKGRKTPEAASKPRVAKKKTAPKKSLPVKKQPAARRSRSPLPKKQSDRIV